MDIFIGGGGDDLRWLGLGVVREFALTHAATTGSAVLYFPNGRPGRVIRAVKAGRAAPVNLIGHSWGAIDAFRAAVTALNRGWTVANLITLDPVSGPFHRPERWPGGAYWLNVTLRPLEPDPSDRLTRLRPLAYKPSRLPLNHADREVILSLHHWDVEGMMRQSGALERLKR
jgi:pimeloyl-ACP methyl ester carboxylesterase